MVVLRYMFWAMALFMFGGCAASQVSYAYRWDVLAAESSGGGHALFAAGANGLGYDAAGGVLLNQRAERLAVADWPIDATLASYRVDYRDEQRADGDRGGRWHRRHNDRTTQTTRYTIEYGPRGP